MYILVGLVIVSYLIYRFVWYPTGYWKRKGVPYIPAYPIVGNYGSSAFTRKSFADNLNDVYSATPDQKIVGIMSFTTPSLLLRHPDVIRQVAIQEFDHFADHLDIMFNEDVDPILGKNLVALKGLKWKNMRSTLSPAFTGSKMRGMFTLIDTCGKQMVTHLTQTCKDQPQNKVEVELKGMLTRFTNDVIATTAFGFECDTFKEPDNIFYKMSREGSTFNIWKIVLTSFCPFLMKMLNIQVLPNKIVEYFGTLVLDNIKAREENHIERNDMLNLLMMTKKGNLKHEESKHAEVDEHFSAVNEYITSNDDATPTKALTDVEITAQAFVFFIAGFETVSVAICFALYELAVNPEIQEKVQKEIDECVTERGEGITYESIKSLKYLDMIVSETLRKWAPAAITDRMVTKPFLLEVDGIKIHLEPKMAIHIPMYPLHRDPNYFPNPDKFDPERFNDENKGNIVPGSYIPFGIGPRNCIGSRFALMEVKLALVYLLNSFNVLVNKKTPIPLKLNVKSSSMTAQDGFWVDLQLRNKN